MYKIFDGMNTEPRCCRSCGAQSGDIVGLWDGQSYCRDCTDSVSSELFEYAAAHRSLVESAQFTSAQLWRAALRFEAGCFFVVAALCWFALISEGWGLTGALWGIGISLGLCIVQGAVQLPAYVWCSGRALPTVVVSDGMVHIRRRFPDRNVCAPLHDFRWRIGHSRQDSFLRQTMVPKQRVILLLLGPGRWGGFFDYRVACGWAEEMRRVWSGFLVLAGRPEV